MKVNVGVNSNLLPMIFARVSWFYPCMERHDLGKPVQLWRSTDFESFGIHSFVPIDHIVSRCAHSTRIHRNKRLMLVVPLVENVSDY